MRLDQFVAGRTDDLSRGQARRVIEIGGIHIGGKRVRRCSQPVRAGDVVEVYLDGLPLEPWSVGEADILSRDKWLLALNKPAGVETQPTPARYRGTLYEALLVFLGDPFRPLDRPPLGMVQRLDRDTSGVIVFSIHPRAHGGLTAALGGGKARKVYHALVAGAPETPTGEIRSLLARRRADNRVKSVARGGKEAITRYRLRAVYGPASLLEVEILTGRTHQIRAHLSEAGHPLLGDTRYGGPARIGALSIPRQMLHAARLELTHPVTGAPLVIEAPVPEDMQTVMTMLESGDRSQESGPWTLDLVPGT